MVLRLASKLRHSLPLYLEAYRGFASKAACASGEEGTSEKRISFLKPEDDMSVGRVSDD
jgi:hypothetical protein